MRPLRPACGTVLKAQLLSLPGTISASAPGVVTAQLSHPPPASSSATEVLEASESRPATAQPPEPPPTTTKSNVSVTLDPPKCLLLFTRRRHCEEQSDEAIQLSSDSSRGLLRGAPHRARMRATRWLAMRVSPLRHQSQHLFQPREFPAIRWIKIGQPAERRAIEHRFQFTESPEPPFAVIGAGAGRADATHRLIDLGEVKQAIVDGDPARDGA